jgi:hypothetical protein
VQQLQNRNLSQVPPSRIVTLSLCRMHVELVEAGRSELLYLCRLLSPAATGGSSPAPHCPPLSLSRPIPPRKDWPTYHFWKEEENALFSSLEISKLRNLSWTTSALLSSHNSSKTDKRKLVPRPLIRPKTQFRIIASLGCKRIITV